MCLIHVRQAMHLGGTQRQQYSVTKMCQICLIYYVVCYVIIHIIIHISQFFSLSDGDFLCVHSNWIYLHFLHTRKILTICDGSSDNKK